MDPTTASFKRYWEPSYIQAMGLSMFAGLAATFVTQPVDFIKTVIQYRAEGLGVRGNKFLYQGYNPHKIFRQMHSLGEGMGVFYRGFEANLASRLGYLAIRNTLYKIIYDMTKPVKQCNDLTWKEKAVIGGFTGGIAAYLTTPFSLIYIRQVLDTQTKKEWRRNYSSINSGLEKLGETNSKFKGSFSNVLRHVALNVTLTGPFDIMHEGLYQTFGDYDFVKPTALLLASMFSALVTLPLDSVRTRLMNAHEETSRNRLNYKSYTDVFKKILTVEGNPKSLWSGFTTYLFGTYVYAWLTVGITDTFTTSWKRKAGLVQWQV